MPVPGNAHDKHKVSLWSRTSSSTGRDSHGAAPKYLFKTNLSLKTFRPFGGLRMLFHSTRTVLLTIPMLATCMAFAQTSTSAPPPAPGTSAPGTSAPEAAPAAAPAAPTWSIGGIDFSGTVDGYYNWN